MGRSSELLNRSYGTCDEPNPDMDANEDERLLYEESSEPPSRAEEYASSSDSGDVQEGVRKIEAISQTWTKGSLLVAYIGIFLIAFCTSLETQTVSSLSVYATSSFNKHSLISTVFVVQNVVNAVIKAPMAKMADVFGRFEAFCIAVVIYVAGYIQMAVSTNVQTYASAQIFYSAGSTGLQILLQIFVADSSSLLNRGLFTALPAVPFLFTVWLGPLIAAAILEESSWRWGYGMWTIILPCAFLPLGLSLYLNQRRAKRLNLIKPRRWSNLGVVGSMRRTWYELDVMGLLLLTAGVALILIPLTLASRAKSGWHSVSIIVMIVLGCVCLVAFPFWETSKRFTPRPLLSLHLLRERTVVAGCAMAFLEFLAFYFSVQPYFYSYLQVVQNESVVTAGRVTQTFSFSSTIAAIAVSIIIKYKRRYRFLVTTGACVFLVGLLAMIAYRREGSSTFVIVCTQIVVGVGGGLMNIPVQLAIQASASHQEVAAATAMYLTSLELGGAVGSAISGAVWTTLIPRKLGRYLPEESQADATEIFGKLTKALSYPMGSPTRVAINRSYQETMNVLLVLAFCVSVPLIPLSLAMKNYRLDKMKEGTRGKVVGDSED